MKGGTFGDIWKICEKKSHKAENNYWKHLKKKYLFLKSIRLKSHSGEKPKKRSYRSIKRFLQTENFKKMQGVPFDEIRKFSKKVAECRKKPKGGTL